MFGNIELEKRKFHYDKNLILLEKKSLVSSGKKNINISLITKMMIITLNLYT